MHPALSPLFNTAPLVATFYFVVATGVQSGADVQVWIVGAHVMAWQARRRTSTALRSGSGATFERRNLCQIQHRCTASGTGMAALSISCTMS